MVVDQSVLITRPQHLSEVLQQQLATINISSVVFPVMAIRAVNNDAVQTTLAKLDAFSAIIFTSIHAVHQCLPTLQSLWPEPPAIEFIAIGPQTAKALSTYTKQVTLPNNKQYHSESLLELPPLRSASGKQFLIVKGIGGRNLLQQSLSARQATVTTLDCYERCLTEKDVTPIIQLWNNHQISASIITSQLSLDFLFQCFQRECREEIIETPMVVISPRVAQYAKKCGVKIIYIAENASHSALFDQIRLLYGSKTNG